MCPTKYKCSSWVPGAIHKEITKVCFVFLIEGKELRPTCNSHRHPCSYIDPGKVLHPLIQSCICSGRATLNSTVQFHVPIQQCTNRHQHADNPSCPTKYQMRTHLRYTMQQLRLCASDFHQGTEKTVQT